ncbi:hypothetical protein C8J57DRAFT_1296904 [Mycena rebaudengoi]|nr:hypothetical protein C8J57DRAFT_1296904 [Mycena rebaudengoi]
MAFALTRPSSPVNHSHIQDEDPLTSLPRDMRDKERPCLEVHLDNEFICLKGTGNDIEPARLTGHVVLYLAESTPIKEITLQFRGKARLPVNAHDSIHSSGSTYIVCNHDWSFLEGEKKHSHTLKAGRHFFPFQLQIGGSLPSSITTNAFGGASVAYKLRANAVRPGLNHNLQSVVPVHIVRSFTSEALEYQQTLEIENTWPEKLMYSIMIPHKAWAATDTITALVKFCPLLKGVSVVSVNTSIHEMTKLHTQSSGQEYTRIVASVKHEIVDGKAVEKVERSRYLGTPGVHSTLATHPTHANQSPTSSADLNLSVNAAGSASHSLYIPLNPEPTEEQGQSDIVTYLSIPIPPSITPTHSLEPIVVSHRLRWNILIMNVDGHTSELRCSLPLRLLDQRLLEEARAHTAATRRLLLGGPEVPPDEIELPSYKCHVRDRIANMYLPEAATMRITNPWMQSTSNPMSPLVVYRGPQTPGSVPSGYSSPLDAHVLSHLPHVPGSGSSRPLDWVNSELLLSLQPVSESTASSSNSSDSEPSSRGGSRPSSSRPSRRTSRNSSPERHNSSSAILIPVARPNETYVHSGNASRNLHGVFNASMKPFTSLAHPHWLSSSRSTSHTSLSTLTSAPSELQRQQQRQAQGRPLALLESNPYMLLRAYTEVPDYDVASRGFIGGVPPLSSMRGLPSYEEAERSQSATLALH